MNRRIAAAFAAALLLATFFTACSRKTTAASFIGSLDFADSLIKNNQTQDAFKLLKTLSNYASTGMQYLAVVKRYFALADYASSEKLLQKALKEYPKDAEVRAVYAHFLILQGSPDKAAEIAAPLEGTTFGSILTEAKIRSVKNRKDFLLLSFVQNYIDAARNTYDTSFLRNAAYILAKNGEYGRAGLLHPKQLFYYEQPLFWAYISYDAQNYAQAMYDLELIDKTSETLALQADILTRSERYPQASQVWSRLVSNYPDYSPIAYTNAALYAKQTGSLAERADFLFLLVTRFPDYVPGLVQYARLALETSRPVQDDEYAAALRRVGLFSRSMEAQAKLPRVSVEDAFKRIETALKKSGDPRLAVEYVKLQWEVEQKTAAERTIDLWLALEAQPDNLFMAQYAIWFFMLTGDLPAARQIFDRYALKKYGTADIEKLAPQLTGMESEFAACLLAPEIANPFHKAYRTPLTLYEKAFSENPESYPLVMNMANVLNSARDSSAALELYARAANLAATDVQRSEAHLRAAEIYASKGDKRNAVISVQYALNIAPENTRARLLQRKLAQ